MKRKKKHIIIMALMCSAMLMFGAGCSGCQSCCESCGHCTGSGMCAAGEGCLSCGNCWSENSCALSFCAGCNKKVVLGE